MVLLETIYTPSYIGFRVPVLVKMTSYQKTPFVIHWLKFRSDWTLVHTWLVEVSNWKFREQFWPDMSLLVVPLSHRGLHPISKFITVDYRFDFRVGVIFAKKHQKREKRENWPPRVFFGVYSNTIDYLKIRAFNLFWTLVCWLYYFSTILYYTVTTDIWFTNTALRYFMLKLFITPY